MSQIFYSEVDINLQQQLNKQARAGRYSRTSEDIAFMLEKKANVELIAYAPPPETKEGEIKQIRGPQIDKPLARLGGNTVLGGRYLPSGNEGYLNSLQTPYNTTNFKLGDNDNNYKVITETLPYTDNSRRIAPYIRVLSVTIGDGAIGALNKATIGITIPNPERDLNEMESIWMRPGRYATIRIQHPDTAIIGDNKNLTTFSLPDRDKLRELYPAWATNLDQLKQNILQMNKFDFAGLITSFDLSYTSDGSVEITLSLTGTSDIYTDITLLMDPSKKKKAADTSRFAKIENTELGAEYKTNTNAANTPAPENEFYLALSQQVDEIRKQYETATSSSEGICPFIISDQTTIENPAIATDRFILFGQPFQQAIARNFDDIYEPRVAAPYTASVGYREEDRPQLENFEDEFGFLDNIDIELYDEAIATYESGSAADLDQWNKKQNDLIEKDRDQQKKQFDAEEELVAEITDDNRYITLGGLLYFLNNKVLTQQAAKNGVAIICSDMGLEKGDSGQEPSIKQIISTYYQYLKSIEPEKVLLLPPDPTQPDGMNWYGDNSYYKDVITEYNSKSTELGDLYKEWPGIYQDNKILPSRIFINLDAIEEIIKDVSNKNTKKFTVAKFLESVSSLIKLSTGGAINMVLTADKDDPETIIFADTEYIQLKEVVPYEIPMFANHPAGTIVQDFQFSAKLPDSVKNLSYTLNQGTSLSTEKIAPYMNYLLNVDSADDLQKLQDDYTRKHEDAVNRWKEAAAQYGRSPQDTDVITNLNKSLATYLQYPTKDIKQSIDLTAPIFPFDASFTISGINGFRYGDVLKFPGLPAKYTANTVFSIIKINHDVSSDGQWKTKINTIMRPNIN